MLCTGALPGLLNISHGNDIGEAVTCLELVGISARNLDAASLRDSINAVRPPVIFHVFSPFYLVPHTNLAESIQMIYKQVKASSVFYSFRLKK